MGIDMEKLLETTRQILIMRGGPTSGNWGHGGRKGKRGGSGRGGGFKRIGIKPQSGKLKRKDVKRKAGSARATLKKDVETAIKNLGSDFFKETTSKDFYAMLEDNKRFGGTALGLSTKNITLSQAQALASHYEKTSGKINGGEQEKFDKKSKGAVKPHVKSVVGNVKNAKEVSRSVMVVAYDEWVNGLSPDENDALSSYAEGGYVGMNARLRGNLPAPEATIKKIDNLSTALNRTSVPKDIIVHRGASLQVYTDNLGNDPSTWPGRVFDDPGFLSTTINKDKKFSGVPSQISVHKGQKAGFIGSHPDNEKASEEELLFPPGSKQRILSVEIDNDGVVTNIATEMLPNF